jgi:hypothetical protein
MGGKMLALNFMAVMAYRTEVYEAAPSHGVDKSAVVALPTTDYMVEGEMTRKGTSASDIRSESERVRPRGHGAPFGGASTGEPNKAERALRERVLATLQGEPEWANADLDVEVRGSTVWLKGCVDTINAKFEVEESVKRIRGVEVVENDLTIRVGEALEEFRRDADAARLRDELRRSSTGKGA